MLWGIFFFAVVSIMVADFSLARKQLNRSFKQASFLVGLCIITTLCFGGMIWHMKGSSKAIEFITGYLVELSLSLDNVFVFVLVFKMFSIPRSYQPRVLFWGILSAIIMRAIMIYFGALLIQKFTWTNYIFGAVLLFAAYRMLTQTEESQLKLASKLMTWVQSLTPLTDKLHGQQFFVKERGKWVATPLLVVLAIIEMVDLVFAVDSIPAIFAITQDTFIVYTSNMFAIIGLRSLYVVVERMIHRFTLLTYSLSFILLFVALKLLGSGFYHIPPLISLSVIGVSLAVGIISSLLREPKK